MKHFEESSFSPRPDFPSCSWWGKPSYLFLIQRERERERERESERGRERDLVLFIASSTVRVGLGGSIGCASDWWSVGCGFDSHRVWQYSCVKIESWNIFFGHSLPSADARRTVVSFWRKNMHNTGQPLRVLSLPRNSMARYSDQLGVTLMGHKTSTPFEWFRIGVCISVPFNP